MRDTWFDDNDLCLECGMDIGRGSDLAGVCRDCAENPSDTMGWLDDSYDTSEFDDGWEVLGE